MRSWFFGVMLLVAGLSVQARTLLVSDVDDTIKVAHVRDFTEAARYAFDSQSRFLGMNRLYNLLVSDNPDIEIVYLSRAPDWLMGRTHRKFLLNGSFPEGQYINRTKYDSDVHKLYTLRDVMARVRPDKVIFVGDNGEQDAEIYKQISEEFAGAGVSFHQFIRIVYANNSLLLLNPQTLDGQVGFVTPIEMGLELEKAGLLSEKSLQSLISSVVPDVLRQKAYMAEGDMVFPYFVNCREFQWKWDQDVARFKELSQLKDRLVDRCKIRP